MTSILLLARHVIKTSGLAMLGAAILLLLLQMLFSYIAELGELKEGYSAFNAFMYILWQSPKFLYDILPIAGLMGAVIGLGSLASSSELIIMRSVGLSLWRIVSWVLWPALLLVVVSFALSQWVLPYTNEQARVIQKQAGQAAKIGEVRGYWTREGNRYIYVNYANSMGQLKQIEVIDLDEKYRIRQTLTAQTGAFKQNQQWQLQQVEQIQIQPDSSAKPTQHEQMTMQLGLQPRFVQTVTVAPEDLAPSQLIEYMRYLSANAQVPKPYVLALWQKIAAPFALISLVVIACSFIFGPLRQQSVGFRLVIALFIGLGFRYLQDFLSYASLVYSPSPAWFVLLPIVICFGIGAYLLNRAK
ncbi:LPS export ABC transporter permease LptG [Alkanindiges hydrocarboniclasticus]|uniref:LPS export ABC transporter permease LptG n=1 Tax=Alkanindiges hydrocarboniclasticus TaxID=1907941 RepID=A0A1S8CQX9_9GAMM|nr:LPS export ABC transporter permease LptG [Alkanindiges hydrocarboniclasticus]ONG37898.1 LPS export ABC transporter permease LptG [Alkanindiges hydrocarboniclasticus]